MHIHGFKHQEGTIKAFVTFCEHLEYLLDEPALKKQSPSNDKKDKKNNDNDRSNGKKETPLWKRKR